MTETDTATKTDILHIEILIAVYEWQYGRRKSLVSVHYSCDGQTMNGDI